jgi:hypothetical protein
MSAQCAHLRVVSGSSPTPARPLHIALFKSGNCLPGVARGGTPRVSHVGTCGGASAATAEVRAGAFGTAHIGQLETRGGPEPFDCTASVWVSNQ